MPALLCCALAPAAAQSAVLLEQSPPSNPYGAASSGSVRAYDDFRLSSDSTITSLTWWSQAFGAPTTGTFDIQITSVSGFYPSSTVYETTLQATEDYLGGFLGRYTVSLPTPLFLTGGTNFFLSIYRTDGSFAWAAYQGGGVAGVYGGGSLSVSRISGNYQIGALNEGWRLEGYLGAPLPAVPEPASWALMVAGVACCGAMMRQRARPRALA